LAGPRARGWTAVGLRLDSRAGWVQRCPLNVSRVGGSNYGSRAQTPQAPRAGLLADTAVVVELSVQDGSALDVKRVIVLLD